MATRLLVLPSTDATHLGHWQTAPLPVLLSTMRNSLFLMHVRNTLQSGSLCEQLNSAASNLQYAPDEHATF
jgi:hypothetical protein